MSVSVSEMVARPVRLDDPAERARAVEIVARGIPDIPHLNWLFGDLMSPRLARWFAEIELNPKRTSGVNGAFTGSGELCGVVVWTAPDHLKVPPLPEHVEEGRELVGGNDAFMARFKENSDAEQASVPGADVASVVLAAVAPDYRRSGVLWVALQPLIAEGRRRGLSAVVRAGDRDLADSYIRKFGAVEVGSYTLTDGPTVWVLEWEPSP